MDDLDLGKLSMETKTKKSKQKESPIGRSLHGALASEFSEAQIKTEIIGEGESILEHKTCDILAAERLRLMIFDC